MQSLLRAIGGCPGGEIYAAGEAGVLLRRRTTGQWSRLRVSGTETFTGVACDHGRVAVTRADGELWLVSGATTLRLPTGFERAWHAVSGAAEGPSWLVGMGGRLATIEADHVRTRTAGPTVPIRDLGAMGGALVAVGEWGRILREQESGLVEVSSPTEAGLAALVPIGEGRLLAVGDFGAAVDIRFDRATLLATPTQLSLRDAVYEDEDLLVVGAEGTLLRGTLDALTRSVVPDAGDLWAVDGTPEAALVVGDGGLVLRVTPSGFTRVPCAIGGVGLRDVARTPAGTFAVGEEGVVVRIEEAGCVEERRGGPTLLAIGVGPEGRPLAGGDGGVVVERTEEGTWTPVAIDVAGVSIRVIWRTSRDVYLAGTGGALIRHIALDGP